jgi:FAD:protein FMN transferase
MNVTFKPVSSEAISLRASSFRGMGCTIEVEGARPSVRIAIERLFVQRECIFSRFLDDSELASVNRSPGATVFVSETFADGVARALWAERATQGLVTPLVHDALVAAGYDRNLTDIGRQKVSATTSPSKPVGRVRLRGRLLERAPGSRLDLAGVVKGMTVDAAIALLDRPGYVSAGGDIAVTTPTVVDLPGGGAIVVGSGGIATSGTLTRSWPGDQGPLHHLIDPRSGRPSDSQWASVTVAAESCSDADVAAKAAFLLGSEGLAWLDRRRLPGRFLHRDGTVVTNDRWRSLVGDPQLEHAA